MPDKHWTLGYELAFLKELAAVYKADFGPHTYGAFGLPKERDCATALKGDHLAWTRRRGASNAGPIEAVCTASRVGIGHVRHKDFCGREATMLRHDIFVRTLAGSLDGKTRLLQNAIDKAGAAAIWCEAHVENRETDQLLRDFGFEREITKVAAASELKGLYLRCPVASKAARRPGPLDPADKIAVGCVRPGFLEAGEDSAILGELGGWLKAGGAFADHYSSYNKRHSWSAVALRGFDPGDPGFIIKPSEMSKQWKAEHPERMGSPCAPTIAEPSFPTVRALLARLEASPQRVRFMRLAAEGELTRHADITDPEAGTAAGKVGRFHIPLLTSQACAFRSWRLDGVELAVHMKPGSLYYLDTRKPHAVVNPAGAERIHLVLDLHMTPALRDKVAQAV